MPVYLQYAFPEIEMRIVKKTKIFPIGMVSFRRISREISPGAFVFHEYPFSPLRVVRARAEIESRNDIPSILLLLENLRISRFRRVSCGIEVKIQRERGNFPKGTVRALRTGRWKRSARGEGLEPVKKEKEG